MINDKISDELKQSIKRFQDKWDKGNDFLLKDIYELIEQAYDEGKEKGFDSGVTAALAV